MSDIQIPPTYGVHHDFSFLEENNSNLSEQLQHTEAEKEQTIYKLEERLVREAIKAITETKNAIALIENRENEAAIVAIE